MFDLNVQCMKQFCKAELSKVGVATLYVSL
jgi:hypothetical protein